jgi:hypothetical protein
MESSSWHAGRPTCAQRKAPLPPFGKRLHLGRSGLVSNRATTPSQPLGRAAR